MGGHVGVFGINGVEIVEGEAEVFGLPVHEITPIGTATQIDDLNTHAAPRVKDFRRRAWLERLLLTKATRFLHTLRKGSYKEKSLRARWLWVPSIGVGNLPGVGWAATQIRLEFFRALFFKGRENRNWGNHDPTYCCCPFA